MLLPTQLSSPSGLHLSPSRPAYIFAEFQINIIRLFFGGRGMDKVCGIYRQKKMKRGLLIDHKLT